MRTDAPARRWGAEFYRQCRAWHGYLSALAFVALIFFSVTGLLLNHPEWLEGLHAAKHETVLTLPADVLRAAQATATPAKALAVSLQRRIPLRGVYASGEILDGEALLHFESAKGASDATINLETGRSEISIETANPVTLLNDLHRGKNAGAAWRGVIVAVAYLLLAMSLIGYVLFFSLRFRLVTSLVLTALSIGALLAIFFAFVP